jgi:hypothetical protein
MPWKLTSGKEPGKMLAAVLEEEVNVFLGRYRYARSQRFRGNHTML